MEVAWKLLTSRESLAQAISAAAADIFSSLCLYPIDYVKLRCQADSSLRPFDIVNDVGFTGLYKGLKGKIVQSAQQKMQYFYVNSILTQFLVRKNVRLGVSGSLLLGYISALEGLLTTLPLESTNMRMIVDSRNGGPSADFFGTLLRTARTEGVPSMYKSIGASAILCVNPAITYVIFEAIKSWLLRRRRASGSGTLRTFEAFVAGVISKIIATTCTFPAIRAKVLINTRTKKAAAIAFGDEVPDPSPKGVIDTIQEVARKEGFLGLYVGLRPQMLKAVLNAALMLTAKERIKSGIDFLLLP